MDWGQLLAQSGIAAGIIGIGLRWLAKKLNVPYERDRQILGRIGIEANEAPQASVAEVLEKVEADMVDAGKMKPEAAKLAVAAAQVKNALPTGPDAEHTAINDVWTGTREPLRLLPPEPVSAPDPKVTKRK